MTDTPLELFLQAFDRLDADGCAALFADHGRLRYVDRQIDEGALAVHHRLREYFADLSSTTHTVRESWHEDRVWVGEVEASYVLADHSILGPVSKVVFLRMASGDIEELWVYAAVEPFVSRGQDPPRTRAQQRDDGGRAVGATTVTGIGGGTTPQGCCGQRTSASSRGRWMTSVGRSA
jgi:hypothetical protein